ncbi:hypothetical protein [Luteolibacter marinus]|uniref:hypothetical protein n=1 Tax=Luteolibacter marinus TaxID=2776705 RepID=UPI0018663FF6|nr:hypothetical protein [Luteolibacter marinus]
MTTTATPCGCRINCRCGHSADFMEFRTAPVTGELPRNHYQCPACRRAWKIVTGPPAIGWSGMALPGKTSTVEIPAYL